MGFGLTIRNTDTNYTLKLDGSESLYQIVSVTGLAPVPATVNMSDIAGADGGRYNSARLSSRNIVITLKLNEPDTVRKLLEAQFYTKAPVRLDVTTEDDTAWIEGYINTFECDPFSANETAQISVICPIPFFYESAGASTQFLDASTGATIETSSVIDTGVILGATIGVGREITRITFVNQNTGEAMDLVYAFQPGDAVLVNTRPGQKTVQLTRSGTRTPIFGAIQPDSVFFAVKSGANVVKYLVNGDPDSNRLVQAYVSYMPMVMGV